MTAAGLITLTGLLLSFFYVRSHHVCICVQSAWWCVFMPFVAVSVGFNLGADSSANFWLYGIPAIVAALGMYLFVWRSIRLTQAVFLLIFPLNALGNAFGLDQYKMASIDILDVTVWIQIGLLLRLRHESVDEILSGFPGSTNNKNNVIRIIHGVGGTGTSTKA